MKCGLSWLNQPPEAWPLFPPWFILAPFDLLIFHWCFDSKNVCPLNSLRIQRGVLSQVLFFVIPMPMTPGFSFPILTAELSHGSCPSCLVCNFRGHLLHRYSAHVAKLLYRRPNLLSGIFSFLKNSVHWLFLMAIQSKLIKNDSHQFVTYL